MVTGGSNMTNYLKEKKKEFVTYLPHRTTNIAWDHNKKIIIVESLSFITEKNNSFSYNNENSK